MSGPMMAVIPSSRGWHIFPQDKRPARSGKYSDFLKKQHFFEWGLRFGVLCDRLVTTLGDKKL
jgi:hypothetical protein